MSITPATRQTSTPTTLNTANPSDFVDAHALNRIDYHVYRLGRAQHLSFHQREDLRQDLVVDLCEAFRRYDPHKSSPRTFVSRVLARAAAHRGRCIRNERRCAARSPILLSQLQRDGGAFSPLAPRWCEPTAIDLVIDLGQRLAQLNRRQQQLAESLKTRVTREIAADHGVHPSTVYRDIAAIRASLHNGGCSPAG